MMNNDRRAIWERYVSAWKETAADGKAAALAASVDANCVYRDPLTQVTGHAALIDYMLGFHKQIPGGYFETTSFIEHHDRSMAHWTMRAGDGTVAGEGVSYGEYNAQGKLVVMTGFFALPPQ
jgi:hypothetical protein